MKYRLINTNNRDTFEREIQNYLENGWKLEGNLIITFAPNGCQYFTQAVTK